ncbi:hypothetical protein SynROS8604_00869 [Synechococcus sp. ROS8604]|nr:hypothetical protein SynROS8604_00869 [Synechococcus sp. ROS8604]
MFKPRFRSGTVLNPCLFLLALEIKPAGFFVPTHTFQANQISFKCLQIHSTF